MDISDQIRLAFQSALLRDEFIEQNQHLMELEGNPDLLTVVPAYMNWCVTNKDRFLVDMNTIHCLAEYGRCKEPENNYLNFKFQCSEEQRDVVINFLTWCLNKPGLDTNQINRAIKNWKKDI